MAVGTTLRGSGTVKGALAFTNTVEGETITGWPTFEVVADEAITPLMVSGTITGVAKLAFSGDITALNVIPVITTTQADVVTHFTGIPEGYTFNNFDGTYVLVKESAVTYEHLYATVSGEANWSELTWTTDAEGLMAATDIVWNLVSNVTLTAEADATIARDVSTTTLSTLTVTPSDYTVAMKGKSLNGVALALTGDLLIADANTLTALPTLSGTGTLKLAEGVRLQENL